MTSGRGVDTAIEAVGVPATFVLCEDIVAPGGTIANVARSPGGSASRTPVVAEHHDHDPARG
jgi:threonine dehydrogenase-like Zn-dependent dehydrogenase